MAKKQEKLTDLTVEELKFIIDDIIDQKFEEWFGDPGEGLEVRPEIIEKLKAQRKSKAKLIPGEEILKKYKKGREG